MASCNAFQNIILNENDVPGAKFVYPEIENHSNIQLQRWLACRGLQISGNRTTLIKRIKECIEAKRDQDISISIDGGKWYDMKAKGVTTKQGDLYAISEKDKKKQPFLPPITGWKSFPSYDLPEHFNEGHIHHYMIESVQFIGEDKSLDTGSDESDIQDLHTSKPLKKGKECFKSGHVKNMKDTLKQNNYYIKASVMASYRMDTSYSVMITLSKSTGFVQDASCTCVASAMGRCSHVSAVLFAILDFIQTFGPDKQSSTSKTCEWNKGRKSKKDPKKIFETQYGSQKQRKVDNLIQFEPRPPFRVQQNESAQDAEHRLLFQIQKHSVPNSMWSTVLRYHYQNYELDNDISERLKSQRSILLQNLAVTDGPEEVTKQQRTEEWKMMRRIRLTASNCKAIFTAKSETTIKNLLSAMLWYSGENLKTSAIHYGNEHEDVAVDQYCQDFCGKQVRKCGLWVHSNNPELACSPDALVMDQTQGTEKKFGLLEVKCPFVLKDQDVKDFDKILTKEQLQNFCLERKNGVIRLKRNHQYYFQVQMQLGVMDVSWCDFYVWSEKGVIL